MLGTGIIMTILIIIIVMISVRRRSDDRWAVYLIKKGNHKSESSLSLFPTTLKVGLAPKTIRLSAMFCDGCDYDNDIVGDSINKLYGVSYGFDHHYRSVRIGWRSNYNLKVIELFIYAYINGKRYIKYLTSVNQYDEFYITMFHGGGKCIIEFKDSESRRVTDSVKIDKGWINWKLFPYFGGKKPAPHNVKILIDHSR